MGKKNRKKNLESAPARRAKVAYVDRPFAGLALEAQLVAMREIIPAAYLDLTTTAEYGAQPVKLVTVLPDAVPALKRKDGVLLVAMQTAMHSGDASRDLAYAILEAADLEDGQALALTQLPEPGPRLQDVIDWGKLPQDADITVTETFDFWLTAQELENAETQKLVEQMKQETIPTRALQTAGVYWSTMGDKEFLRWSCQHSEDDTLSGLARLQAAGKLIFMDNAKFLGVFRACGILLPVWDLPKPVDQSMLEASVTGFAPTLEAAIAVNESLTDGERRAKAGIISRQVNLR